MKVPGILLTQAIMPVTEHMRTLLAKTKIPFVAVGIENTLRALGKLAWWSERVGRTTPPPDDRETRAVAKRPVTEREVLGYLATKGLNVIPATVVRTSAEASEVARAWDGPTVLKVLSPDIQHKTEVGGVVLNLTSPEAVAIAFDDMMARVRAAKPEASIEGAVVSPMRSPGIELIVGTTIDPQWGPVIVVGMGGVWVEVLKDTALRLLPITHGEAIGMVESLRSAPLLRGYRGSPAVDLDALAGAIVAIGNAALDLGNELESLEVNPLRVDSRGVEALDGVAIWRDAKTS